MNNRFAIVFVLLLAVGAYVHLFKPEPVLLEKPLANFPVTAGEWRMVSEDSFSKEILAVLRPTDYMSRVYIDQQGNHVVLYIGYHGGREGDGGIHSPKNCLPSGGWALNSTEVIPVSLHDGENIDIVNTVMSKETTTIAFYYWFQVRGEILTDEVRLKLAEFWSSLVSRRKDAAFIRISLASSDNDREIAERFVRDIYPVIHDYLPK